MLQCGRGMRTAKPRKVHHRRPGELIDDFPRKLTDFEKLKITQMMRKNLEQAKLISDANSDTGILTMKTIPTVPDNVTMALENLPNWPLHVAIHNLSRIHDSTQGQYLTKDPRVMNFLNRSVFPQIHELDADTLIQLVQLFGVEFSPSQKEDLVNEIVLVRRVLDGSGFPDQVHAFFKCIMKFEDFDINRLLAS